MYEVSGKGRGRGREGAVKQVLYAFIKDASWLPWPVLWSTEHPNAASRLHCDLTDFDIV